jgi:hypothetical protein
VAEGAGEKAEQGKGSLPEGAGGSSKAAKVDTKDGGAATNGAHQRGNIDEWFAFSSSFSTPPFL